MDWKMEFCSQGKWENSRPKEKQGTIVGEGERRRTHNHGNIFLSMCVNSQKVGHLWLRLWMVRHLLHGLWSAEHLLHGLQVAGNLSHGVRAAGHLLCRLSVMEHLFRGIGDRGKSLQLSQTPEVGMVQHHYGSVNRHHLWPQSPQKSAQKRALLLSTSSCCSHFPGNTHTLLLPLPNALGTTYSCLRVAATSQGLATRSSLSHFPAGSCH